MNGLIATLSAGGPMGAAVATRAVPFVAMEGWGTVKGALKLGGMAGLELIGHSLPKEVRPVGNLLKRTLAP